MHCALGWSWNYPVLFCLFTCSRGSERFDRLTAVPPCPAMVMAANPPAACTWAARVVEARNGSYGLYTFLKTNKTKIILLILESGTPGHL